MSGTAELVYDNTKDPELTMQYLNALESTKNAIKMKNPDLARSFLEHAKETQQKLNGGVYVKIHKNGGWF